MGMRLLEPNGKVLDHLQESEGHLWATGSLWRALIFKLWKALSHCFQRDGQEGGRVGGREPNSGVAVVRGGTPPQGSRPLFPALRGWFPLQSTVTAVNSSFLSVFKE